MMHNKKMMGPAVPHCVLGIDPGLHYTGVSVVTESLGVVRVLLCEVITLSPQKSLPERVFIFKNEVERRAKDFNVSTISIETPFLGKNAQNFLKLGYLRGIIYCLSTELNVAIKEFSPCEIKRQVVGNGAATKEQVAFMLQRLFPHLASIKKLDATDSLGVALCGLWLPGRAP